MYQLIIEDDEGKTTPVRLVRDEITIGRKEGNTIRLTERNVSRRHAKILKANGSIYIEDQSSHNGTKVNGERIAGRAPITEGDRIQIGDYQLALKLEKSAAPEPVMDVRGEEKTTPFLKEEPTRQTAMVEAPRGINSSAPGLASATAPTQAQATIEDRPARLVVVSSNFAGKEWKLSKVESVIGRTDDNDVVINHRSISRNHAKVVKEQGRYQIVDLGSANGVRVNGEEYGKVELRKGDLIDLGHVRIRFVAPAEDFVFARDAQIVEVDTGGKKGKGLLFGGVAVGLVLVIGIVAVVLKGKGGDEVGGKTAASGKTAEYVVGTERAMKSLDWDTAIAEADKGLKVDPNDDILKDKKAKAEGEKKNATVYDAYSKAAKSNDSETAVMKFQELPETSAYHEKALESWSLVKKDYLATHIGKARSLAQTGKCDEAKHHVEAVLLVDEANQDAQDIAKKCGQPALVPAVHREHHQAPPQVKVEVEKKPEKVVVEKKPEKVVEKVETPPPAPKPAGGNADQLVGEAQDDYVHGNYSNAIDRARKALKVDASNAKAWRIVGASSCFLKDKSGAVSSWNKLGAMDRQFLKYVCQRNAITIP